MYVHSVRHSKGFNPLNPDETSGIFLETPSSNPFFNLSRPDRLSTIMSKNMVALFAEMGILSSTLLPSHLPPRDEGRLYTTPQDSVNGSFIYTRTYPLTIREGSTINISWSMTYENVNLYFYQKGKVANSVQLFSEWRTKKRLSYALLTNLLANLATEWYQWDVHTEETNLTNPFVFRIVNARGTAKEQYAGGFWSTSWYLTGDVNASESETSLSSSASSSTALPSTTSLSPTTSVEDSSSTMQGIMGIEATAISNTASGTPGGGAHKSYIIGLTAGLVIAGAITIAGLLYCLKNGERTRTRCFRRRYPLPLITTRASCKHPKCQTFRLVTSCLVRSSE